MGEILDKPNLTGIFGNLLKKMLENHYAALALLYCCINAVLI